MTGPPTAPAITAPRPDIRRGNPAGRRGRGRRRGAPRLGRAGPAVARRIVIDTATGAAGEVQERAGTVGSRCRRNRQSRSGRRGSRAAVRRPTLDSAAAAAGRGRERVYNMCTGQIGRGHRRPAHRASCPGPARATGRGRTAVQVARLRIGECQRRGRFAGRAADTGPAVIALTAAAAALRRLRQGQTAQGRAGDGVGQRAVGAGAAGRAVVAASTRAAGLIGPRVNGAAAGRGRRRGRAARDTAVAGGSSRAGGTPARAARGRCPRRCAVVGRRGGDRLRGAGRGRAIESVARAETAAAGAAGRARGRGDRPGTRHGRRGHGRAARGALRIAAAAPAIATGPARVTDQIVADGIVHRQGRRRRAALAGRTGVAVTAGTAARGLRQAHITGRAARGRLDDRARRAGAAIRRASARAARAAGLVNPDVDIRARRGRRSAAGRAAGPRALPAAKAASARAAGDGEIGRGPPAHGGGRGRGGGAAGHGPASAAAASHAVGRIAAVTAGQCQPGGGAVAVLGRRDRRGGPRRARAVAAVGGPAVGQSGAAGPARGVRAGRDTSRAGHRRVGRCDGAIHPIERSGPAPAALGRSVAVKGEGQSVEYGQAGRRRPGLATRPAIAVAARAAGGGLSQPQRAGRHAGHRVRQGAVRARAAARAVIAGAARAAGLVGASIGRAIPRRRRRGRTHRLRAGARGLTDIGGPPTRAARGGSGRVRRASGRGGRDRRRRAGRARAVMPAGRLITAPAAAASGIGGRRNRRRSRQGSIRCRGTARRAAIGAAAAGAAVRVAGAGQIVRRSGAHRQVRFRRAAESRRSVMAVSARAARGGLGQDQPVRRRSADRVRYRTRRAVAAIRARVAAPAGAAGLFGPHIGALVPVCRRPRRMRGRESASAADIAGAVRRAAGPANRGRVGPKVTVGCRVDSGIRVAATGARTERAATGAAVRGAGSDEAVRDRVIHGQLRPGRTGGPRQAAIAPAARATARGLRQNQPARGRTGHTVDQRAVGTGAAIRALQSDAAIAAILIGLGVALGISAGGGGGGRRRRTRDTAGPGVVSSSLGATATPAGRGRVGADTVCARQRDVRGGGAARGPAVIAGCAAASARAAFSAAVTGEIVRVGVDDSQAGQRRARLTGEPALAVTARAAARCLRQVQPTIGLAADRIDQRAVAARAAVRARVPHAAIAAGLHGGGVNRPVADRGGKL